MNIDDEDDIVDDIVDDNDNVAQLDDEVMETLKGDCKELAKIGIHQFFDGKKLHCGGTIPKATLDSDVYVDLVLHCNVCDGTDVVYDALESAGPEAVQRALCALGVSNCRPGFEDANILLAIHRQCKAKSIHKAFIGGLTIMYLELCLGIEIRKNAAA